MQATLKKVKVATSHSAKESTATVLEITGKYGLVTRVGAPDQDVVLEAIGEFGGKIGSKGSNMEYPVTLPDSTDLAAFQGFVKANSQRVVTMWTGERYENRRVSSDAWKREDHQAPSEQQLKILNLIADGLTNQEIAEALFISPETVKTHIVNLRLKLLARDKAMLVAQGFRLGYLQVPPPTARAEAGSILRAGDSAPAAYALY